MARKNDSGAEVRVWCPHCGGAGFLVSGTGGLAKVKYRCPSCGAQIWVGHKGSLQISVQGNDAVEVATVARQLADDAAARRETARMRSPWFSGLFYLMLVVVIVVLLLAVGRILALWALPLVAVAAVLLVSLIGALQMRQDNRLSERGFLRLMADVFRRLPLMFVRSRDKTKDG